MQKNVNQNKYEKNRLILHKIIMKKKKKEKRFTLKMFICYCTCIYNGYHLNHFFLLAEIIDKQKKSAQSPMIFFL